MDADKVHHCVVGAGVHDEAAVVANPHGHVSLALRKFLGDGVLEDRLKGNEEPEGALAGSEGHNLRTDDNFACDRLQTESAYGVAMLRLGAAYANSVRPQD